MEQARGYAEQAAFVDRLLGVEPPRAPRRRWPYAVLAVVLVVAAVAVAVGVGYGRAPSGPAHPGAWDERVQPYVDFVEEARDLEFEHPVYVDFLPDADFEEQVTRDEAELTDEDRDELEQSTGLLRALGLLEGDVDLFEESNRLHGTSVVGFYSYDDERLRIRGTELTPAVESTLVHELTHALQDQHFDLGTRLEKLRKSDEEDSEAAASGFDALVEGDARRIETTWRDHLGAEERKALDRDTKRQGETVDAGIEQVPEVLTTMLSAPYVLGEALLAVAVEQGGERSVDELFRTPPSTEEHQVDPWTLVVDHQGYLTVPAPELAEGDEPIEDSHGAFGSLGWLMLLSERVPVDQALSAVDGWGGDAYTAYRSGDRTCVQIGYRADTPLDLTQMESALTLWVAKGPEDAASVTRQDQTLLLTSCDPGRDAPRVGKGRSMDALQTALTRTAASLTLAREGMAVPAARCAAGRLVQEFPLAQLNAAEPTIEPKRLRAVVQPCLDSA